LVSRTHCWGIYLFISVSHKHKHTHKTHKQKEAHSHTYLEYTFVYLPVYLFYCWVICQSVVCPSIYGSRWKEAWKYMTIIHSSMYFVYLSIDICIYLFIYLFIYIPVDICIYFILFILLPSPRTLLLYQTSREIHCWCSFWLIRHCWIMNGSTKKLQHIWVKKWLFSTFPAKGCGRARLAQSLHERRVWAASGDAGP
jgi:hypothetical protein